MQTNYVWVITILVNILSIRSSNGVRPKRDLLFIKDLIDNIFGYNTNNAILYPVPDYQFLMNVRPDLYMNQNMFQGSFPQMLIPNGMVMQPLINFRQPDVTAFNERNYKTTYPNFGLPPVIGKMQRVNSVPNYNGVKVPLARCNDKIANECRKDVSKNKAGKLEKDNAFSNHESPKLWELTRDTEETSKDVDVQRLASSQFPPYKNIIETPASSSTPPSSIKVQELLISPAVTKGPVISQPFGQPMALPIEKNIEEIISNSPVRKIQSLKTSTTSPSSTVNLVQTDLSSSYAETTVTTEIMKISTSTPPSSTNIQELITSHAVSTSPKINQILSQSLAPQIEEGNEEITSKSPEEKIQSLKTSTISPSSTVNLDETNLSSSYAETTVTTAIMPISTSSPPSSTNVQELITSHAVSTSPEINQILSQSLAPQIEESNEEITSKSPVEKIQSLKTSTISPSSTVNLVQTNLSSSAETNISTEIMPISTSTPPAFTNVQELVQDLPLTTLAPPLLLPDKSIQDEALQPIVSSVENKNEEVVDPMQPNRKDEINSNFNPQNLSKSIVYEQNNTNKSNEDTVLEKENITYTKDVESPGDLISQPSIFTHVIDMINSINPSKGKVVKLQNIYIPQNTDDSLQDMDSGDMEINEQTADVYPSDTEELVNSKRSSVTLNEPSYGSDREEGSQNKSSNNVSKDFFRWLMSSDSAREISRGDVPDV